MDGINEELDFACLKSDRLYPTASNSLCCWCTQTCKLVLKVSYSQNRMVRSPDLPLLQTSEAATVWAETCNQHDWQERRPCSLLETQMKAAELDCESGFGSGSTCCCLFSGGLGKKPWPSTLLAAQAVFCAGLPNGRLRRVFAGGFGRQRLHLPGPGDAGRRPPMAWGVSGPAAARMSALQRELHRRELKAWGKKKLKLTSSLWKEPWLVGKGSSSFQVPATKDPDMFVLVSAHLSADWPNRPNQIKLVKTGTLCLDISLKRGNSRTMCFITFHKTENYHFSFSTQCCSICLSLLRSDKQKTVTTRC